MEGSIRIKLRNALGARADIGVKQMSTKQHFVKMETAKGWLTYFNPSEQRMQRLIQKHKPKNIYLSVNRYLRYKEHNMTYPNIIIQRYGFIDIDGQNFNNKEETRQYFIEVNKFLKNNDICVEERVRTNNTVGGYQITIKPCCYSKFNYTTANPLFSRCDGRVYDSNRVRRLKNTWNSNHDSLAVECDSLGMPLQADDKEDGNNQPPPCKIKGRTVTQSKLPAHFIYRQINNSIYGTKGLYICAIKLIDKPSPKRVRKLQHVLNIGDIYLFRCHNGYFLVAPKAFSIGRLCKIYSAFHAYSSLNELQKFKLNWIPISSIYDLDKHAVKTFEFIDIYECSASGQHSIFHCRWLNKYHKKEYPNLIGCNGKVFVVEFRHD